MIYYYFGSKDDLFLAVLEAPTPTSATPRSSSLLDVAGRGHPPAGRFTWHYYLEHPEFITLLNSENLHRRGHLKRSRHDRRR